MEEDVYLQIVHDQIFVTSSVLLTETEVGLHHPHRKALNGTWGPLSCLPEVVQTFGAAEPASFPVAVSLLCRLPTFSADFLDDS